MKSIIAVFLLLSSTLYAGEGGMGSGGGDAVVCQGNGGAKTAELLDFYEGENIFGDQLEDIRNSEL